MTDFLSNYSEPLWLFIATFANQLYKIILLMDAFWVILTGTLVAASSGILGCFLLLRKMSMIGDAISHAVLPGIFIAYWFAGSGASFFMLVMAAIFGILCTYLIELFTHKANLQNDAAIGLTFTLLFAIGVILVSAFADQIDLDQECILYGDILYVSLDTWEIAGFDIPRAPIILSGVLLIVLATLFIGYRGFFLTTFDPAYAVTIGISTVFWHYLLMGLVSLVTVVSFESVGAILVVAFLIGPAATAYLLTDDLLQMLFISVIVGFLSALGGYYLSVYLDGSTAGAMACVLGLIFSLSFFFSPKYGLISKRFRTVEDLEAELDLEKDLTAKSV